MKEPESSPDKEFFCIGCGRPCRCQLFWNFFVDDWVPREQIWCSVYHEYMAVYVVESSIQSILILEERD